MTEKRCPACKKFKELQHFHNDGGFCVTRPSFKICADCRARARNYHKKMSRCLPGYCTTRKSQTHPGCPGLLQNLL